VSFLGIRSGQICFEKNNEPFYLYPLVSGLNKGILSIILGLLLTFDPDKSAPKLNYITGMFWATSGIALLRHGPIGEMGKRLSKLISVVAILTGLLVGARYFLNSVCRLWFRP